jgi:hypothetical protein
LRKTKLGAITGVLFFALAAVAFAIQANTVNYESPITVNKSVLGAKNIDYNGVLDIGTESGVQPNTAPLTELFFAKQLRNNAKKWPSCKQADLDGKNAFPAKCKKAIVGTGTATSSLGAPGGPPTQIPLDVIALNGNKGKQILLALTSAGPPFNGSFRVIPGTLQTLNGDAQYGYKVGFAVPENLQGSAGGQIALTHFDVHINKTTKIVKKVKKGKKKVKKTFKLGYLQLTKCPAAGTLPVKAIVHFNNDDQTPSSETKTDEGTFACK